MPRVLMVAAKGSQFTLIWATSANGRSVAKDFFDNELSVEERAKIVVLFQRLSEHGRISNREHFRRLGDQAKGDAVQFWEFKRFQTRFIGEYRPGRLFVIAVGCRKKKDNLDPEVIARATRILSEFAVEDSERVGSERRGRR